MLASVHDSYVVCVIRQDVQKKKKTATHRGQGGSWHAFISKMCRGKRRADFKALSGQYKLLDPDDAETVEIRRHGKFATETRRLLGHHLKPFGTMPSKVRLKQMRELRNTLFDANSPSPLLQIGFGTQPTNIVPDDSVLANLSFSDKLSMARRLVVRRNAAAAKHEDDNIDKVKAWQDTHGKEDLEFVLKALPALRKGDHVLTPMPMGGRKGFEVAFDEATFVGKALAHLQSQSRGVNLQNALDSYADARAQPLQAIHCQPCPPAKEKSKCYQFGLCTCKGSPTYPTWLCRNVVYDRLKKLFPTSAPRRRKQLVNGSVFLKFVCSDTSSSSSSSAPPPVDVWLHVALMYLNPYRPTFHKMILSDPPLGDPPLIANREYLQVYIGVTSFTYNLQWCLANLTPTSFAGSRFLHTHVAPTQS